MEKLTREDGSSPDLAASIVDELKRIVPEVFAEGQIDFDVLKQALGEYVDDQDERYSFTWHGKSRARQIAQMTSTGTLLPCPEESVRWDSTKNIFIEGDNLEVLKLLQKSYHRKVKMIYIDPPYNTGSDFIYPDKWQDNLETYLRYTGQIDDAGFKLSANSETSGRYHTNWLNMMYPRVKLARNLLRDDGVIFVSIDDHEVQQLRQILDDVFGSENFICTVIWHKVYVPKNSARHFSEDHDYILVYAKAAETWSPEMLPRTAEQDAKYKNLDNDPRGRWRAGPLAARNYYGKGTYPITCPSGRVISGPPSGSYWRYSEEKFKELDADGRIYWGEDGNNSPATKLYLSEVKAGRVPQTIWPYSEVGHTQDAKKELLARIAFESSATVFDTPKPMKLVRRMLQIATKAEDADIVLDFFAGSGTTGDAVMQANSEDGGNRRFVLVQLPQPTGAKDYATVSEITKARLRAASEAHAGDGPADESDAPSWKRELGFRVLKLSSSNIKPWDADFESIENDLVEAIDNIKADRSEDDVLYELLLKYGLDLAVASETRSIEGRNVTVIGAGALVVCLADDITLEVVSGIVALKDEFNPDVMRVVFKDSGFAGDVAKTNAAQILRQAGIDDVKSL